MSLGVHFALAPKDAERLRELTEPEDLVEYITEDLEERYLEEREWAYQSDKAWDAIHRCLADGQLLYETGPFPLAYAVLGGEALDAGDDYTACLVDAGQVRDLAAALVGITKTWMRERYDTLGTSGYSGSIDDQDFEYTWTNFVGLREFFAKAAAAKRPVLFTTDA